MVILTAVSRVAINFGRADQQELDTVSVSQMRRYLEEGHFPAGSMGPKIEAVIKFIDGGGRRAVIGHLNEALPAIKGETGTHILPD